MSYVNDYISMNIFITIPSLIYSNNASNYAYCAYNWSTSLNYNNLLNTSFINIINELKGVL